MSMILSLAVCAAILSPATATTQPSHPPVSCHCEHLGSTTDDICEAYPQDDGIEYAWYGFGGAVLQWSPPESPFKFYACRIGQAGCHIEVTVRYPDGSSSSPTVCHGH